MKQRQFGLLSVESSVTLDATGLRIVEELQRDGRLPLAELGRRVALSPPAVADRVRRLEDAGVITGYTATVDPARLGLGVLAFVRLTLSGSHNDRSARRIARATELGEVLECHRLAGEDCYILKVAVRDTGHLEALIERLGDLGRTHTSIVLSSPLPSRPILPIPAPAGGTPAATPGG